MRRSACLPRNAKSRSPSALSIGQRLLLLSYVALFAFFLPFICWGALAEPGHPHRTPHFVFADPMLVKAWPLDESTADLTVTSTVTSAAVTHRSHTEQQGKPASGAAPAVAKAIHLAMRCHLNPTDNHVSGRATPTLLLFSILLLLLTAASAFHQPEQPAFVHWVRSPLPQLYVCTVPLPPPRLSF